MWKNSLVVFVDIENGAFTNDHMVNMYLDPLEEIYVYLAQGPYLI